MVGYNSGQSWIYYASVGACAAHLMWQVRIILILFNNNYVLIVCVGHLGCVYCNCTYVCAVMVLRYNKYYSTIGTCGMSQWSFSL